MFISTTLIAITLVALGLSIYGNVLLYDRCNAAEREAYFLLRKPHAWSTHTNKEARHYGL